jgi:hypothetical protein
MITISWGEFHLRRKFPLAFALLETWEQELRFMDFN